jgi:hypothetical protein
MGHDRWNPSKQSVTLEMARAAGLAHGETAFTAMVSPEIFEESLKVAMAAWRSAGFTSVCLDEAEAAARAAYRGSSAAGRVGGARPV